MCEMNLPKWVLGQSQCQQFIEFALFTYFLIKIRVLLQREPCQAQIKLERFCMALIHDEQNIAIKN